MFSKTNSAPHQVTTGRFELERDGKTAYLEYSLGAGVLTLAHTEIPKELRGHGLASTLAKSALDFATENRLKVDVVCSSVAAYIEDHPEYSDLVIR
jgi:uncharacterized protein